MQEATGLLELLQPEGGLFSSIASCSTTFGEPGYTITNARSGDLSQLWSAEDYGFAASSSKNATLGAGGVDLEQTDTLVPALAEGLERYCTTMFLTDQLRWATRDELGDAALNLERIPCASETELADPQCPLGRPSHSARIRWVEGTCLHTGQTRFVPAILAFLYFKPLSRSEALCVQITTGCAAHRTYDQALLGGLLEVIERDSIALTWLQKLALPRIMINDIPPRLRPYWDVYLESSTELEYLFFDATSDLGVPTVYGLQRSTVDARLQTIVCCASAQQPVEALIKVMRDMASSRRFISHAPAPPDHFADFRELSDGAVFMARADQTGAFEFLTHPSAQQAQRTVTLADMVSLPEQQPSIALRHLLDRFAQKSLTVIAVDLSSDEAIRAGMRVVRVIVPELQPFAFNYRARYLGHPRLYQAPRNMCLPAYSEPELNHWPQPFA